MQNKKYIFLDQVNSPEDLRDFDRESTEALAQEIRDFLIDNVSECGGHLASNLGVVELSLALHRVFDTPKDKIVWDVGHQSYVHKIITGRKNEFSTLRKPGGLSGFTKREESEFDPFGAGHSSTSISAALGIAEAEHLRGGDSYTVAVVGDGAFTGGMIYEALNNCDRTDGIKLIIVLNENEMSISKNIGSVAKSLSKLRNRPGYFRTKAATRSFLGKIPFAGKYIVKFAVKLKKAIKNILYGSNYFENLGLYYIGPVDGHDIGELEDMLSEAKKYNQSVIVHVKTQKGRGYQPAEEMPDKYHAVAPKDAEPAGGFSRAFGDAIVNAAEKDHRICAITAAMGRGTGLAEFEKRFPERFFDVGIAEEHAVTFAAGLAAGGALPVCAIYSTFLQRSYDNIIHDVALQGLPVILAVDRAGLNASDGATHHGIFDVAFLSTIPDMTIFTPATYECLERSFACALSLGKPAAIRYPNAVEDEVVKAAFYGDDIVTDISVRSFGLDNRTENVIITHGRMVTTALEAVSLLSEDNIPVAVVLCEYIKPYDALADQLSAILPFTVRNIIFLEEEILSGGFGMNLAEEMNKRYILPRAVKKIMAVDDSFVIPKAGENVWLTAGVDAQSVYEAMKEMTDK
ncbi:MAG: 1-deoxy-D-xylulose-5-phosphate synthase [Eubacteriales bacterium]